MPTRSTDHSSFPRASPQMRQEYSTTLKPAQKHISRDKWSEKEILSYFNVPITRVS